VLVGSARAGVVVRSVLRESRATVLGASVGCCAECNVCVVSSESSTWHAGIRALREVR